MLLEGFRLMAVGMTTVFVFLTLLVGLMRASAVFFEANAHRFPEVDADDARDTRTRGSSVARVEQEEEIAIAIAIADASRRGQEL